LRRALARGLLRIDACGHTGFSILFAVVLASQPSSADVARATITETSGTVSRGSITVDAPPGDVYALVTDYANWRRFLTDIVMVKVKAGSRRDAVVAMESRALEHEVTIAFDNEAGKAVRFKLVDGPPGARAKGEYVLVSLDEDRHTRIDAMLYMDVVGVVSVLVGDKKIRSMRQAKLRADLEDVARWFRLQRSAVH
jgi:uncharacterized membrane protein